MNVPTECDIADKERQHLHGHYFKPVQHGVDAIPSVYAATSSGHGTGYPASSVPRYGTVIPNRVFVGGIDFKTKEEDLQKYFCTFGVVRDTKIIRDRAEVSKGYGFVTFETPDEADKVREQQENLYLNGKKLNIGPAVRKQQLCFPRDIHMSGPPGGWVMHPAGYASYTNQNGITYFSPASPLVASQVQPQGTMLAYNGGVAAYQPVAAAATAATHYTAATAAAAAGYGFATACGSQPYNTVHMPWSHSTVAGSCGQLVASTANHSGLEQVNLLPVNPSQALQQTATGYLVPRNNSMAAAQTVPISARAEAQPLQQEKIAYMPASVEPVRMLMPTSATAASSYVQPMQPQPILHSPTAVYAQTTPIKCGPSPQFLSVHHGDHSSTAGTAAPPPTMLGQYSVISIPGGESAVTDNHSPMVVSENEIRTPPPPMTPDKAQ